jgi:ribosomal-protein-serine acetyltransferase
LGAGGLISTPPVAIRTPEPGDAGAVAAAVRESLPELLRWMDWATLDYDEETATEWIAEGARAREAGTSYEFLVVDAEDRLLGTCGINQINTAHRLANLGYWIRSSATGNGFAGAAVRELQRWVFANTQLERLEIVIALGNTRSERVAEKAGAFREGVLRSRIRLGDEYLDASMFSLIRPRSQI